jgi:hypothetical protein
MEFEMKKPVLVSDGVHQGEIVRVEYRDKPYRYSDIFIKITDKDSEGIELKFGCPCNHLSPNTKFGKLLLKFAAIPFGDKVDPEKVLIGRKVSFQSLNEQTADGNFARIVDGSIKPIEGGK